ncbi:hypothetical protein [Streptomyces naganishii]|uniref:Uncharacterized protein n=1 Tax=Streptomyces naganishii JCM 4654 TaxID=1306179 RepID=A0A918Y437_9ACTN|nr:hypothetical protein GCM10010508_32140 [Streptomyces naganishii JCM 4654]
MEPEPRTDTERPLVRPDRERESRPDTERRDLEDCDEVRELRPLRAEECEPPLPPDAPEPCEPGELSDPAFPPDVTPVGGDESEPFDDTTGARPQVSQYSSPPPTSS